MLHHAVTWVRIAVANMAPRRRKVVQGALGTVSFSEVRSNTPPGVEEERFSRLKSALTGVSRRQTRTLDLHKTPPTFNQSVESNYFISPQNKPLLRHLLTKVVALSPFIDFRFFYFLFSEREDYSSDHRPNRVSYAVFFFSSFFGPEFPFCTWRRLRSCFVFFLLR